MYNKNIILVVVYISGIAIDRTQNAMERPMLRVSFHVGIMYEDIRRKT